MKEKEGVPFFLPLRVVLKASGGSFKETLGCGCGNFWREEGRNGGRMEREDLREEAWAQSTVSHKHFRDHVCGIKLSVYCLQQIQAVNPFFEWCMVHRKCTNWSIGAVDQCNNNNFQHCTDQELFWLDALFPFNQQIFRYYRIIVTPQINGLVWITKLWSMDQKKSPKISF